MNDAINGIFCENFPKQGFVPHIAFVKRQSFAGKLLHPLQGLGVGVAQIVDDNHITTQFQQFQTGVRTDIAGTAGNKYMHMLTS